jgi:dipeptidyl aminopeptidase/acylaminoacyl peptidase
MTRLFLASAAASALLFGQTAYKKPQKEVLDVLHAPATPVASVNPSKTHVMYLTPRLYPSIADLAAPMLRLAGLRVNPANFSPHGGASRTVSVTVQRLSDGRESPLSLPAGALLGPAAWSPDGKRFAFANFTPTVVELYVGAVDSPMIRRIPGVSLNATMTRAFEWVGSRELLVRMVPSAKTSKPRPASVPKGPNIEESLGGRTGAWTFQDLLKSPHDEDLFDYYCETQLAFVDVISNRVTSAGKPGVFEQADVAPDGRHILVTRLRRPYSYVLPYSSFPADVEIMDRSGKVVKQLPARPLLDKVPLQGVATGPRSFSWRPTEAATLLWWEALDDGDPKKKVTHRDRLMMWRSPFSDSPAEVHKTRHRARGITHGEGGLALISDYDRDRRWTEVTRIFLDDPSAEKRVFWSRSAQDRYKDEGEPVMKTLPSGERVLQTDGDWIFLAGDGATPDGDRPFLNRFNLRTLETQPLFRAGGKGFELIVALLSNDGSKFLTRYEDPATPPNYRVRSKGEEPYQSLTEFKDPVPQLRKIRRQLVKYKRADGVDLSFTLYLPPDYKDGHRLPAIFYAYPTEFTDPSTAGQIGGSTQRYVSMRGASHLFLLLSGYAILNNASIPIVGDPETMNNTYLEQLANSAKAAIEKAAEMGFVDPSRVGATGHSYGGFMTANLLAHTDYFRAGVARSGAYNRTLTPFGFQNERRTFWQAQDIYLKMSPFVFADKIKEPILLIHGEADNNTGTYPIQSERLYQAIRGNGGTVRLVMLPHESHGYAARESVEHVLAETQEWFDKYLKGEQRSQTAR